MQIILSRKKETGEIMFRVGDICKVIYDGQDGKYYGLKVIIRGVSGEHCKIKLCNNKTWKEVANYNGSVWEDGTVAMISGKLLQLIARKFVKSYGIVKFCKEHYLNK
jgi:hypothetical protein